MTRTSRVMNVTVRNLGAWRPNQGMMDALHSTIPFKDILLTPMMPKGTGLSLFKAKKNDLLIADPRKLTLVGQEIVNLKVKLLTCPVIIDSYKEIKKLAALCMSKGICGENSQREYIFPFVFDPISRLFAFTLFQLDHVVLARGFKALHDNGLLKHPTNLTMIKGVVKTDLNGKPSQIAVTPFSPENGSNAHDQFEVYIERLGQVRFHGDIQDLTYNELSAALERFGFPPETEMHDMTPTNKRFHEFLKKSGVRTVQDFINIKWAY